MPLRRWLIGTCLGLLAMTGCKDEEPPPPPPTTLGNGTIGSIKPAAHDETAFTAPLDATPNPNGDMVFFTARDSEGAAAVFKSAVSGGGVAVLYAGDPISGPVGITVSTDSQLVFVADPGASTSEELDLGVIWSLPAAGGAPSAISGTAGYAPRGILLMNEANADVLYFTGKTPGDSVPGVFKVHASGGTVETIAKGEPFSDPNGIAVSREGLIYVVDSAAEDLAAGSARVIEVKNKVATTLQEGLKVGFPAGIAMSQDDAAVLISALDPATGKDQVVRLDLVSKQQTANSQGIDGFDEAAGLHRAANAEVYAWADSSADGSGTVFVLTPQ